MSWTLRVAELGIAQSRYGVVFVQAVLRLGRGFDVPLEERPAERRGDFDREQRLAGAGLALDQQWPLERDRGIHRHHQVLGGDVRVRAFEAHEAALENRQKTGL